MKCVHKFVFESPSQTFRIPKDAEVLSVGAQNGQICLWALVHTSRKPEERHFEAVNTGPKIDAELKAFLGRATVGPIEWHIFEVKK